MTWRRDALAVGKEALPRDFYRLPLGDGMPFPPLSGLKLRDAVRNHAKVVFIAVRFERKEFALGGFRLKPDLPNRAVASTNVEDANAFPADVRRDLDEFHGWDVEGRVASVRRIEIGVVAKDLGEEEFPLLFVAHQQIAEESHALLQSVETVAEESR